MVAADTYKRDSAGKFTVGNKGGPGRMPRRTEESYLASLVDELTPDKWQRIVQRAIHDAEQGDATARAWLSNFVLGTPKMRAELSVKAHSEEMENAARAAVFNQLSMDAEKRGSMECLVVDDSHIAAVIEKVTTVGDGKR